MKNLTKKIGFFAIGSPYTIDVMESRPQWSKIYLSYEVSRKLDAASESCYFRELFVKITECITINITRNIADLTRKR